MHDRIPSPVPIHEVPTGSEDVKIQQLVVGRDRQGKPYVLTLTAHRQTGELEARLGQSLDETAALS